MNLKSTNFGVTIIALLSSGVFLSSAGAATIAINASAPSGNILASQLTDLGAGTVDVGRNFADNGGPPGQTFTVSSAALLGSITVKGRGDSSDVWDGGQNAWEGNEIWGVRVGSVGLDGSISVLGSETATGFTAGGAINIADYLTFQLATPISVSPGTTYAFSIYLSSESGPGTDGGWFGLAHSDTDTYAGGVAINDNTSIANPGGNSGGPRRDFPIPGFAAPIPGNYDYVFAIQAVPEPTALALMSLGAVALLGFKRRHI